MSWFTNRGQIIQVVCAVIAVAVAVMTWLSISPQMIASIFPDSSQTGAVIFSICLGVAVGLLAYSSSAFLTFHSRNKIKQQKPDKSENHTVVSAPPLTEVAPVEQVKYDIKKISAPLGKRIEFKIGEVTYAVVVHGINEKESDAPRADIQMSGTGPLRGGVSTKRLGSSRFLVPITPSSFELEEGCIYSLARHDKRIRFFFLNVEHIDVHSNEVTYVVCASIDTYF